MNFCYPQTFENFAGKEKFLQDHFELQKKWARILDSRVEKWGENSDAELDRESQGQSTLLFYKFDSAQEIKVAKVEFFLESKKLLEQQEISEPIYQDRLKWRSVYLPVPARDLANIKVNIVFSYESGLKPFRSGRRFETLQTSLNLKKSNLEKYVEGTSQIQPVFEIQKTSALSEDFVLQSDSFVNSKNGAASL